MIKWFCQQTIKFNLLVMFLSLAIIPLIFSITQNYYFHKVNLVEMTSVRLDGVALGHSKLVGQWFQEKLNFVKSLSTTLKTTNSQSIHELLLNIRETNPEFRVINYVNISGEVVTSTAVGNSAINVSDRGYFKEAVLGKDAISEILISRTYHQPCIVFASPVKRNGKIEGIIIGSVALSELKKIVDVSYEGKTFKSFLVGDNGYYIVPPASHVEVSNKLIPIDKTYLSVIKKNSSSGVSHITTDTRKLAAYRRVPEARATIVVLQDEIEATQGAIGQGLKNNVYITLALILVVIPLAFWLANKLSRPLEQISSSLRNISLGDFSQRIVLPLANREIRVIADDINLMGEQLQTFHVTIEQQIISLDDMANTDQLTGLYNRRFLTAKLFEQISISLLNKQDLCIAMLDIDYFKKVNDTYGHNVGDQVLKELAQLIQVTVREVDVVARFGGEEFIILANTGINGGKVMAEKVRHAVMNHIFKTDLGDLRLTVSLGLADLFDCKKSLSVEKIEDCLLRIADINLYKAKRLGRNQVAF